jgi:fructose-bisphosphate aldolase class 1
VIAIGGARPSRYSIAVNAHALARYAVLCQEAGIVPIVEPEVLMDGNHDLECSDWVTGETLRAVFAELLDQRVALALGHAPWSLSFSFGRALHAAALRIWAGSEANVPEAQAALAHRVRCSGEATLGRYSPQFQRTRAA